MWRRRRTTSSFANIHNRAVINNVINRPPQPGSPVTGDAGLGARPRRTPRLPGCAGAGCRYADPAACGRATGHADPAGQGAGAAERRDQSCRADRFARRSGGAGRKAERAVAGQCAGRAAAEPDFAEDQCAAGSRRQGRAGRAAERCGIAPRRRQSECEACAGRPAAGWSRREARDRRDRSGRFSRSAESRNAATRRRAKARRCDRAKTSAGTAASPAARRGERGKAGTAGGTRRSGVSTAKDGRPAAADGCTVATPEDGRPAAADGCAVAAPEDGRSAPTYGRAAASAYGGPTAPDGCATAASGAGGSPQEVSAGCPLLIC